MKKAKKFLNQLKSSFKTGKSGSRVRILLLIMTALIILDVYLISAQKQDQSVNNSIRVMENRTVGWLTAKGRHFPFKFLFPRELKLKDFANDPTDAIGLETAALKAERNIVFNVESVSYFDKKYVDKPDEFVRNYWRYFNGLKGVRDVAPVINDNGLKGYRIYNINKFGQSPAVDLFFIIPKDPDHLLHFINGAIPNDVFTLMVNSLTYGK